MHVSQCAPVMNMHVSQCAPVMNMADEMVLVWKHVSMRNEPSFLAVPFSGSDL